MATPKIRERPNMFFCLFPGCKYAPKDRRNVVQGHIDRDHENIAVGIGQEPKISDKRPHLETNALAIMAAESLTVTEDE